MAAGIELEPCRFSADEIAEGNIELVGGPSDGDRHPIGLFRGHLPQFIELAWVHTAYENRRRTIPRRYLIIERYTRRDETTLYDFARRQFYDEYKHPDLFGGFSVIQKAVTTAGGDA